jgi:rubrerythrin
MNITDKLTQYDLTERLHTCLKMEMQCAEIYHSLVKLFPEASDLFQTLAEWEERHADIISVSIGFNSIKALPDEIVPYELSLINKTLNITRDIKARIGTERVTLKSALSMALEMEESFAESYLQEVMGKTTDSEVISYLQQFYKDGKTHAEMIKEFMSKEGFSPQIS